jgi:tripartite ATP-independent transporter DctM subunit
MAGAAPTARPAPFLKPLDLLDRGILLAESSLSVVVVIVMVLAAVLDTLSGALQAFAGVQLKFAQGAGDVLMNGTIWAAFLGASFATRGRRHLAIDAIGRLLPDRARRVTVAIAATLGAVVAFALARGVYEALAEQAHTVAEQLRANQENGIADARVDRSYEYHYVIPFGFVLIALRLLMHGFHEFLAAYRGGAAHSPIEPASDKSRVHHAEPEDATRPADEGVPAEAAVPAELEKHVAPVSQASGAEIVIAIGALIAVVAASAGSTIFAPVSVIVTLAVLTLGVPLVLRWRNRADAKTNWLDAPVPSDEKPLSDPKPVELVVALVGVAVVLGLSWLGVANIASIPVGVGVAFFAGMALLGAPLFTFLGGLALFLWLHGTADISPLSLPQAVEDVLGSHFARMSALPTIPVFTLAGYLMSEAKTAQRLVRVARAFLGTLPGGIAVVCIVASALFTVFSGASGITIVAIGGLLFPALLRDKYPERFSLGLVTTGGALGITFFPCLPLIVYGIVAGLQEPAPGQEKVEIQKLAIAGIAPGLLIIVLLSLYAVYIGIRHKVPRSKFELREALAALWDAKWELMLPAPVYFGLIFAGPGGAAAFTAFYVLIIETFVYKDLSLTRDLLRIIPESMVLVGAIFVKICAATVLTFFFVQAQTADKLFESLTCGPEAQAYLAAHSDVLGTCREAVAALAAEGKPAGGLIDSPITFLLALNVFLLVVGMLMDIFSAIVVIVPLISGIALFFGINPYHLGIVFLINLEIGYLMPPMGLNLFIAGFRFNRPVPDLYRVVLPFIGIFVFCVGITTYWPTLTLFALPGQGESAPGPTAPAGPAPTDAIAPGGEGGDTAAPAGDCDQPGADESFEDFEKRCLSGEGAAPADAPAPGGAAAVPADCEQPRADEAFADFERRCLAADAPAPADAPTPADAPAPAPAPTTADAPAAAP